MPELLAGRSDGRVPRGHAGEHDLSTDLRQCADDQQVADDFTYVTHEPTGPLGRYVASIWYARGRLRAPAERVAPTGSAVLGLVLGAPIAQVARNGSGDVHLARTGFLLGPDDQPMLNRPLGETWCVGVVATPIGCATAFGVDPRCCGAGWWARSRGRRCAASCSGSTTPAP